MKMTLRGNTRPLVLKAGIVPKDLLLADISSSQKFQIVREFMEKKKEEDKGEMLRSVLFVKTYS